MAYYYPDPSHTFSEYLLAPPRATPRRSACRPRFAQNAALVVKYRKGAGGLPYRPTNNHVVSAAIMRSSTHARVALLKEGGGLFHSSSKLAVHQARRRWIAHA